MQGWLIIPSPILSPCIRMTSSIADSLRLGTQMLKAIVRHGCLPLTGLSLEASGCRTWVQSRPSRRSLWVQARHHSHCGASAGVGVCHAVLWSLHPASQRHFALLLFQGCQWPFSKLLRIPRPGLFRRRRWRLRSKSSAATVAGRYRSLRLGSRWRLALRGRPLWRWRPLGRPLWQMALRVRR